MDILLHIYKIRPTETHAVKATSTRVQMETKTLLGLGKWPLHKDSSHIIVILNSKVLDNFIFVYHSDYGVVIVRCFQLHTKNREQRVGKKEKQQLGLEKSTFITKQVQTL